MQDNSTTSADNFATSKRPSTQQKLLTILEKSLTSQGLLTPSETLFLTKALITLIQEQMVDEIMGELKEVVKEHKAKN